jgi:hypothetical protein
MISTGKSADIRVAQGLADATGADATGARAIANLEEFGLDAKANSTVLNALPLFSSRSEPKTLSVKDCSTKWVVRSALLFNFDFDLDAARALCR